MHMCRVIDFSSFLKSLESCEPLFDDLGFLFFDFQIWEGFFEAKLSSRDQVGCQRSLPEDQNPGIQGSQRTTARLADNGSAPLDSWILVFGEAAFAANLITAWKFSFVFVCVRPYRPPPQTHFQTLQYRKKYILANGEPLYPHL